MSELKISSKLLSDLKSKNINLDIDHFKHQKKDSLKTPKLLEKTTKEKEKTKEKVKTKEKDKNQSFNSSDSLEKTTTTINFKIRPCTPNPDMLFEKKNDLGNNNRSAKTTLTTFPNYKKDSLIPDKEDLQFAILEDEDENIFNQEINEESLAFLVGVDSSEFPTVSKLHLKVDLSYNSLQNLGNLLPNLKQLKINGSRMGSLRDMGTSLINLEILWASRCSMNDISGIMMFQNLKELYISFNYIKDLTDIGFLENLQVLDLEGNEIDLINVEYLQYLKNLYSLNLSDNPITKSGSYPKCVLDLLENLEILDEKPRNYASNQMKIEIINQNQRNEEIEDIDDSLEALLKKFGKYQGEINISEIKSRAEDVFQNEIKNDLKEEEMILYSIKKSKSNKKTKANETMILDKNHSISQIRPKTASIFRPEVNIIKNNFDNGMSSLVSSNDVAFFGNPLKILKHQRNNILKQGGEIAPQNLMNLINEFQVEKSSEEEEEDYDINEEEDIDLAIYKYNDEEENYDDFLNLETKEKINEEILNEKHPEKQKTNEKNHVLMKQNSNEENHLEIENKFEEKKTHELQKKNMFEIKPLKNAKSMEESKSAMFLKHKTDLKSIEKDKITAILNANKEKMKKNLGNLLQGNKDKSTNKIRLRQNIIKKGDSLNKNTGSFINTGSVVKDSKN